MEKEKLQEIHSIQLNMALETKRICENNNINYIIIAGTLLGAVRHKGFIPWDEDIDIGMLRPDYDKFIQLAKNELNNDYFLQTWDTDFDYAYPFAKIRKKGTILIESVTASININHGIFIDIFPFDNIPNCIIKQKYQNIITYVLKRLILAKKNYKVWNSGINIKFFLYKIFKIIAKPLKYEKLIKILVNFMTKYNSTCTKKVVLFGGSYGYKKESIDRNLITDTIKISFENNFFLCPRNYDSYLKQFYGDYMKLPPFYKRYNRHGVVDIKINSEIEE